MRTINLNNLSYLIIAITIPLFGLSIGSLGLPTLGFLSAAVIQLYLLFFTSKNFVYNNNILILMVYFMIICISTLTSVSHASSFAEIISFGTILIFILLMDFSKVDLNRFFKYLTFMFFLRTSFDLVYSFSHMEEWIGRAKHFMRFSVAHLGGDPNNLALLLIAPILYMAFFYRGKLKYIILFIFMIHFTMLYSRGAFLSLALAFSFYIIYFKNIKILKYLILSSFAIVYAIYYLYVNEYIFFNLNSFLGADNSASSRLLYWKEALFDTNFKQAILGNGPRTFVDIYGHWLHNSYVARYVDVGVIGLLLYMTILFSSLYIFIKQQSKYLILFLAFIIGSFFVDFYQNALMWFLIGYAYKNPIYYRRVIFEKDKVSIC
ncbi:hypothetical protein ALC152_14620 [Arcobacter sp. 15-2]|uniref:O-antigen ligase family protein n=1 Tax=Arcobacter sp. 15-2 TaxID=3374109 RepID=UPI00399C7E92